MYTDIFTQQPNFLIRLDEKTQTLELMSYVVFFSMDSRLSGDPQCYGNATSLPLPQSKIWKPPVTLLNGISDKSKTEYDENLVHICHPGVVLWPVGEIQSVGCEIDITYYPFDTQTCVAIYGLTNMNTDDVNLHQVVVQSQLLQDKCRRMELGILLVQHATNKVQFQEITR